MLSFIIFVFFAAIIILNIKIKNDIKYLEYEEWLKEKGFIKVRITFFNYNINEFESNVIESNNVIICYLHSGVYSFVIPKQVYTYISIYPERPTNKNNVKETQQIIINTGDIKSVDIVK